VHGVGGNILEYMHLANYLGSDQPFYGVQARGLDGKGQLPSSVEEMAGHYIDEIEAFQPQGPYLLAGSSFGGLICFEMARQFAARGKQVGLVALFDTHAPGHPRMAPASYARKVYNRLVMRVQLHWSNLALLERSERMDYIREKAKKAKKRFRRSLNGVSMTVMDRVRMYFMPTAIRKVHSAGNRAIETYHPSEIYPGTVTLFRATHQLQGILLDRTNGWQEFVSGEVVVHDVPGFHGAIVREPRVRILAEKLQACLADVYSAGAPRRAAAGATSTEDKLAVTA
jgi:thioesterase domain-containing protein